MASNSNYSVALCTYNGERYIEEQLESILKQTVSPKEIIISDDGSTDRTLKLADKVLRDSGIEYKIVKNEEMNGVTSNFNNAISKCSEEIIFTSDQDDVWLNNKAEVMLNQFSENEKALLVFSNGELVDGELHPLNCDMWSSVGITEDMLKKNAWFEYMLNRCLVTGAAMAFKKELYSSSEKIPICWLHDGWFAWKAAARGGLFPCKDKLLLYRQHGNNVVGMSSVTSLKRIKRYFNNFKTVKDTHIIRYNRYMELKKKMGYLFSEKEQKELDECISFWKDLVDSDNIQSKIKRIRVILKNLKNNNFDKYFNGKRGAIRELAMILLDRRI